MPHFSKTSLDKIATCHDDLQVIFKEVIRHFDCTVLYGHRTVDEQQQLYKIGRKLEAGKWIKTGGVVTNCDGIKVKSKHNSYPSVAIDVVPYPINWTDVNRMRYFAGFVLGIAQSLYSQGKITHELRSGLDWDRDTELRDTRFQDAPHFELVI